MARPRTVVKNELSLAIAELRRRLGLSQQAFANSLNLSIGAVARWELNQRPHRTMLNRLIQLASQNSFDDLATVLYREHRREFALTFSYDIGFLTGMAEELLEAIEWLNLLPEPERRKREDQIAKMHLRELLQRLQAKIREFPPAPADMSEQRVIPKGNSPEVQRKKKQKGKK
jgi:transcriptional regulator with XRE-family HTH domain